MMPKLPLSLLVLLVVTLAMTAAPVAAQSGLDLPPTIVTFESSIDTITLAAAEAGTETATLSWQVVGVESSHRILLQRYAVNAWESLLTPPAETLPPTGSLDITVQHPLNFGPPMVRLQVLDAAGRTLEERVVVIDLVRTEGAETPQITMFETNAEMIAADELANGSARIGVTWAVQHRPLDANLVFEQVLEGGRIVSVELPRPNVWVPSQGEGPLAPVMPGTGRPVRLRLRVVNMIDGATLAEAMLPPLAVTRELSPTLTPVAPTPLPPAAPPEIALFTVAPEIVPRGGTVTLTWDVRNASEVGVWLIEPGGRFSQRAPNAGLSGQWTLSLPENYVDTAPFMLFATGASGEQVQASLVVDVICPYTYFFDTGGAQLTCPLTGVQTVQAAFQRFEKGYMVWRGDTSEIYVFYDSGLMNRYRDTWQGEPLTFPEPAPEGLYRPDRGFGKVWIENPQVRTGLGWAVTLEQGYTMRYQRSGDLKYSRLYLDWPDGTVIYIVENTWEVF